MIATVVGEDLVLDVPLCLLPSCTVQLVKGHIPFSLSEGFIASLSVITHILLVYPASITEYVCLLDVHHTSELWHTVDVNELSM